MDDFKNLEERVSKLESKLETYNNKIQEILVGIAKIEQILKNKDMEVSLQAKLDESKINSVAKRVDKLESNQRWVVTAIVGEVLAVIFGIIMIFIQKGI